MYKEMECMKIDQDIITNSLHPVIEEIPLSVNVNGRYVLTAMISPNDLEDFVRGFLYTEKIIKSLDEIELLHIDENIANVITKNPFKILVSKKTVLSGCGGTISFLDIKKLPAINSDFTFNLQTIRKSVEQALKSDLHVLTGGIHVVALYNKSGKIHIVEDIGRHNALDKIIGYALNNDIDLSQTFIICSGRISSEMVRKCLIANIPVAVSRGATTTLAIETAKSQGFTIIGFVRNKKMNIYSNCHRIEDTHISK